MGDGLGLQGPWGLASLQASIRQRQLDRMAQQQQEFQNMIALRGSNRADAQQQILMQEHAAALAERKAQVEQAGLTARSKLYSPGDVLSPTEGAGLPTTPQTTLPSTQIGGGMALPGADTTPTPPPAPTTTTSSPGVTTGKLIYRGTDVQRTGEEQKAARGRLLANPMISPRDRLAIEMETAGLKVPTGFERPQNQPVMRVNPRTGKVEQIGDAPAGAHFATEPPPPQQPNPQPQIFKGPDGKDHAVQFVNGVAKEIPLPTGFRKPIATTETRLASAQAVNQTGEDIIAQLSDPATAAKLGPAMGRFAKLQDFIGNPPPEFSELAGSIESYALANMGVHGMRSAQGAAQIASLLSQPHTPESLIASIRGLNKFSTHFMENEGRPTGAPKKGAVRYDMNGNVIK